jgi:hypothetical protein
MTLPVTIPNTFANATTSIPLANLDANFVTIYDAVNGIGNGAESLANVSITGGTASNVTVEFAAGTNTAPSITTVGDTNTGIFFPAADTIAFAEGGAEAMRIDSSGNVGIGTTSPVEKLHISGGTNDRVAISGSGSSGLLFNNTGGTALFQLVYDDASSDNVFITTSGNMVFRNQGGTQGGSITERARITSGGDFLVAKTTTNDSDTGFMFQPARDGGGNGRLTLTQSASTGAGVALAAYSSGASAYRFYVDMAGTVFATNTTISAISDQRYKENIRDLDIGLDAVMQLKPRKFDWKEGKGQNTKDCRGFIAQEFERVFPDLIDEWKDPAPEGEEPYKSVRQDLIPVLVKAIQEQQTIIESLKSRIEALENK